MRMKVSAAQALSILRSIPHDRCQAGIRSRWRAGNGAASAQSALWLYCWAKTGMGSPDAADAARRAFDAIFDIPYGRFAALVPHAWAQENRYNPSPSVARELQAFLDNPQPSAAKPPPRTAEGLGQALDEVADRHLGVCDIGTSRPHHGHRSSALRLGRTRPAGFDAAAMLNEMLSVAERLIGPTSRFEAKGPSAENWRFTQNPTFSPYNTSPETTLERAIVRAAGSDWANQVPTASGLLNATQDRHRNIDLVRRIGQGCYEFIELKLGSDTPLRAAVQLLQYAVLYVFARRHYAPDLVARRPLLQARQVILTVLAPAGYYADYPFAWLEEALDRGAAALGAAAGDLRMSFRFHAFPADFVWPADGVDPAAAVARRAPVAWAGASPPAAQRRSAPAAAGHPLEGHKRHLAQWARRHLPAGAFDVSPGGSVLLRPDHRHRNFYRPAWAAFVAGREHRWGHALNSSQAFAVNLFAPLADTPAAIPQVLARLHPELPLDGCDGTLRFEHTPEGAAGWLGERGQPTQVDAYFSFHRDGRPVGALLVEVKYLERSFGACRGWDGGGSPFNRDLSRCLRLQEVLSAPERCAMVEVEGRRYWSIMRGPDSGFSFGHATPDAPCPFRHGLYQLMRNGVLAEALRRSGGLAWARASACIHPLNDWAPRLPDPVAGEGDAIAAFNRLRGRDPLIRLDAAGLADAVAEATNAPDWRDWLHERYLI